jgi:uncharacterized protein (TIGR02444 family)
VNKTDGEFWSFALRVYDLPGVKDACLKLQDEQGLDVMILLCNLWIGVSRGTLPQPALAALMDIGGQWQASVTTPLRRTRRRLETDIPAALHGATGTIHRSVRDAELMAEHLVAQLLERSLQSLATPTPPPGPEAALANARAYVILRGVPRTTSVKTRLALLANAATIATSRV